MNLKKKYFKSWGKVGSFYRFVYWFGNDLVANSIENGETKRMPRRVQMYIHEYLINHISNESETILISILSVI